MIELLGIFKGSFCAYGTALGAVREGDILAHDLDTDIGILSDNFQFDFLSDAVSNGWKILNIYGMRHYGFEIALTRDGIKTDIMVLYRDKKSFFNCLWDNGGRNGLLDQIRHEYPKSVIQITEGELGGVKVKTMGEEYLSHVYGAEWKTPIKSWDWRTDHKCRV